jgi:hypothetical protein
MEDFCLPLGCFGEPNPWPDFGTISVELETMELQIMSLLLLHKVSDALEQAT